MQTIRARQALTADGWREDVLVTLDDGRIVSVEPAAGPAPDARFGGKYLADATWRAADGMADDVSVGILLPAPGNVHSHAFQRAMAGLTETRGTAAHDDFWSWRTLMYAFLDRLDPDDVEAIAAGVMMEMLEAGYAAVGEFHYLHNAPGGAPYANPAELAERIVAAATATGIGLTLLPVIYVRGGVDDRALAGGQLRFRCDVDAYAAIRDRIAPSMAAQSDWRLGVAPHSLRAVPDEMIRAATAFDGPCHIHVAEQVGEVAEVRAVMGTTPVTHLMRTVDLDARWTLIHATQGSAAELAAIAAAGATVGLCPITESNLGDGIVDAPALLAAGGRFGIGSDSNVRIALTEELRTLDHSQRLALRRRSPLAAPGGSSGRLLYETALAGGAAALARDAGRIAPGALADLVALDGDDLALSGLVGDRVLDAWIFAGSDRAVREVWSAGRHVVQGGRHVARDTIAPRFAACLRALRTL